MEHRRPLPPAPFEAPPAPLEAPPEPFEVAPAPLDEVLLLLCAVPPAWRRPLDAARLALPALVAVDLFARPLDELRGLLPCERLALPVDRALPPFSAPLPLGLSPLSASLLLLLAARARALGDR